MSAAGDTVRVLLEIGGRDIPFARRESCRTIEGKITLTATFAPGRGEAVRCCSGSVLQWVGVAVARSCSGSVLQWVGAATGSPEQVKSLAREMKYLGAVLQGVGLE